MKSESVSTALTQWLNPTTWGTWHWADEKRFYEFILAVWIEKRALWDEKEARELIASEARKLHPEQGQEYINDNVEKARSYGTQILDFLSHVREINRLHEL